MACSIKETIAQYEADLAAIRPNVEAVKDTGSTDVNSTTQDALRTHSTDLNRRIKLLEAAKSADQALQADGYPALPVPLTSPEISADIHSQAVSVALADTLFSVPVPPQATTFNVSFGQPVRK